MMEDVRFIPVYRPGKIQVVGDRFPELGQIPYQQCKKLLPFGVAKAAHRFTNEYSILDANSLPQRSVGTGQLQPGRWTGVRVRDIVEIY